MILQEVEPKHDGNTTEPTDFAKRTMTIMTFSTFLIKSVFGGQFNMIDYDYK